MDIKEVKKQCFDLLKAKLVPLGYKPLKKELQFNKLNDFGFDAIWFGTAEYKAMKRHILYIYVSVRVDEVEKLKHIYMQYDEERKSQTVTWNINSGTFIGNPDLEFEIRTPEDVANAVETFWKIYNEHIVAHFGKCYDIDVLNALYPKYGTKCQDWLNASSWYITVPTIAYLANKETFPAFRKEFMDYLANDLDMPDNRQQKINAYFDKITSENSKNNND